MYLSFVCFWGLMIVGLWSAVDQSSTWWLLISPREHVMSFCVWVSIEVVFGDGSYWVVCPHNTWTSWLLQLLSLLGHPKLELLPALYRTDSVDLCPNSCIVLRNDWCSFFNFILSTDTVWNWAGNPFKYLYPLCKGRCRWHPLNDWAFLLAS